MVYQENIKYCIEIYKSVNLLSIITIAYGVFFLKVCLVYIITQELLLQTLSGSKVLGWNIIM